MRLELDTIKQVGEYCKKKPREYHHRCSGAKSYGHNAIQMLDMWAPAQTIECCRAGRKNWMTPLCETCDGQHTADLRLLKDGDLAFNRGIDRLLSVLEDSI